MPSEFSFTPAGADSVAVAYGVDHTLADYIIQNITISDGTQNLEIPDQKGRIAQIVAYDVTKNLSFTAIGPGNDFPLSAGFAINVATPTPGNTGAITVASSGNGDYIVQTVERACTYNDTAKWNVTAVGGSHAKYFNKTDDSLASPITNGSGD